MPSTAWGIDIGNRALKAIKLTRDGERIRVEDFEVIEHEHVLSNAGDNRDSLIQSALANFVQRHPSHRGAVAIGVSGQSSFARFIKLPPVEPKKIPEIVRFEAIQQIPFPLDDVEWSYQLFRAPDSPDVEVGIFAMRKELINAHIKRFTDIGLDVQMVQMNPLAVYNAMYYDQRIQGTTMIVDLGAENTDLIIADGETIWLRSIPMGGNNFTEALVKAFKLNFAKAEDLKRNAPTSKYAKQIFQAMRPVFADLVGEIQRSIGFYASVHRDAKISKIIALGSTFRLPGLQKYLQQNLQTDVERLDSLGVTPPSEAKLATAYAENMLSTVTAYGLALQGLGEGKIVSSLLPQNIRREKLWRQKTKWFAAAAALFIAGTGLGYLAYYQNDFMFNRGEADTARRQIQTVQAEASDLDKQWGDIEQSGTADRQLISNIQGLEAYRGMWRDILGDLYNTLPVPQAAVLEGIRNSDPEKIKTIPRGQRTQVLVDNVITIYDRDLAPKLADPDFRRFGQTMTQGGGDSAFNYTAVGDAPPLRGFMVNIRCTTPFDNGPGLIQQQFVDKLMGLTQEKMAREGKRYYVAKAIITSATRVISNPQRLAQIQAARDAATQIHLRRARAPVVAPPPPMPGAAVVPDNPYVDRITDEDMSRDWDCTILVALVVDGPTTQPIAGAIPVAD